MPITQIPFQDPIAPPEDSQPEQLGLYDKGDWETAYRDLDSRVPHLLLQLQDDLTRSRRREAAWISIITHLVLAILLWNVKLLEKLIPQRFLVVATAKEQPKDVTFLTLPPDLVKPRVKPKTNVLSDKDRIAMSPHPERDQPKIPPSPPPGRPGVSGPRTPQAAAPPPQVAQNQQPTPEPQQNQQPVRQQPDPNTTAQLHTPPPPSAKAEFGKYGAMTPGSAIQQATEAAADSRRGGGGGGQQGDFGLGNGAKGRQYGALDI